MEKKIGQWSYWIGVAGMGVAVIWKVLTSVGFLPKEIFGENHPITYESLMKGAFVFLLITVATKSYLSLSEKSG